MLESRHPQQSKHEQILRFDFAFGCNDALYSHTSLLTSSRGGCGLSYMRLCNGY